MHRHRYRWSMDKKISLREDFCSGHWHPTLMNGYLMAGLNSTTRNGLVGFYSSNYSTSQWYYLKNQFLSPLVKNLTAGLYALIIGHFQACKILHLPVWSLSVKRTYNLSTGTHEWCSYSWFACEWAPRGADRASLMASPCMENPTDKGELLFNPPCLAWG